MKSDELIYNLSEFMIIFLFIYYFVIMVVGGILAINIGFNTINKLDSDKVLKYSFIVSISVSGMLCSIQYSKRLYKACITERIELSEGNIKNMGNFMYFLFRPFFAFVFSIILVYALLSGMFIVTGNLSYILNEKFIYLCAILSSLLGYSIGNILDKFGKISKDKITHILY